MKIMTTWKIPPENYEETLSRFLATGAPFPDGLVVVGRWHAPGSTKGFLLVEGNDPVLLAQHLSEWAGLLEFEITPVIEDAEAGAAAQKARGG
jgi:hypothetical protein